MKDSKKPIMFTVIAVAVVLVAVVGATFAYFVASGSVNSSSIANITTASLDSVSGGSTSCTMNVLASDMREVAGTAAGVPKTTDCTVSINAVKNATNTEPTTCTYDITYTPTDALTDKSEGAVTNSKAELTLKGSAALSVPANGSLNPATYNESDLYNVTTKTTLVSGATFTFTDSTNVTWTFTPSFYNYNFNQNVLADQTFGGTIAIENVVCSTAASGSSSQQEEQAVYWNDNFSNTRYAAGNLPSTTYQTRELLVSNYADFANKPIYIKSTTSAHQACLWANNHEFCLSPNYWVSGDSDGSLTKAKLQADMEEKLGTTASSCSSSASNAHCKFGSFYCLASSSGGVLCSGGGSTCDVNSGGSTRCLVL
jgi:hypothetical protein